MEHTFEVSLSAEDLASLGLPCLDMDFELETIPVDPDAGLDEQVWAELDRIAVAERLAYERDVYGMDPATGAEFPLLVAAAGRRR